MMRRIYLLMMAVLVIFSTEAAAQRTMHGQTFISGQLTHDFTAPQTFGGGVSYGTYLHQSYWKVGVGVDNHMVGLSSGDNMDYTHFHVGMDWMYRCLSTVNRAFSLYAGAGAFVGYEAYDLNHRIPQNISTGLGKGAFLYGARANVEAEIFVATQFALLVTGCLPVHFGSPTGWFMWSAGLGARYNF